MLNDLSADAAELLKGKPIVKAALGVFRWMSPERQVEMAKLMNLTGNYSRSFAQALLIATKPSDRLKTRSKPIAGLSYEHKVDMLHELEILLNDIGVLESYGENRLCLVVASGYISKLISNQPIENYLNQNHPEILRQFKTIVGQCAD